MEIVSHVNLLLQVFNNFCDSSLYILTYFSVSFDIWNIISYVKSRSDKQLRSKADEAHTKTCAPEATIGKGAPIVPCGLIAWSLFNDTYGFSMKNKALQVSKKDIAWKSDQERKFGSDVYPKNFQSGGLIGGAKLNASIPVSMLNLHFIISCRCCLIMLLFAFYFGNVWLCFPFCM